MGKAAHVGVGRLLRVGGLDGVQGRGCMNNTRGIKNMDFKQKLYIILCFHTYKYSSYVDNFIKKLISEGEVLNYDRYRVEIKWRGNQYGVWIENFPYSDLSDVKQRGYNNITFYKNLRPSRSTQIAFWGWMNKQGIYPNKYNEDITYEKVKALLTKTKL
jgi:hypothetical protein